jgi:hypothetical protein
MKKIIIAVTVLLVSSTVATAQFAPSTENLRGLAGVRLMVILGGDPHRLSESDRPEVLKIVEADATAKLEQAGIQLFRLNSEMAIKAGSPKLVITVTIAEANSSTPLQTEVRLLQSVHLSRDPSIETDAVTWSTSGVGGPKLRSVMVREQVASEIDQFIRDYLSVNPKRLSAAKEKAN